MKKITQEIYDKGPLNEPFNHYGKWYYKTETSLYALELVSGPLDQFKNPTKQPVWVWLGNNGSFV